MLILFPLFIFLSGCITTYSPEPTQSTIPTTKSLALSQNHETLAIFPIEYLGPGKRIRNQTFLIDLQKQIASELVHQGFNQIILLNDINAANSKADHYMKVVFTEDNQGESLGFVFGITLGIFPLILPIKSDYTNSAEIQIFDRERNRTQLKTVERRGSTIWHSTLIPVGLFWDHKSKQDSLRNDVVVDIANFTSNIL